jgi:protein phosphatase
MINALKISGETHTGQVRNHNEDSINMSPKHGLVILADGMGGYNAGEVASQMTTSLLMEGICGKLSAALQGNKNPIHFKPAELHVLLQEQISLCNYAIFQTAQNKKECAGMGTTLVACLFYDNKLIVAHIGDSRLYRMRSGTLTQVTRDHSLLQEQIDSGLLTPEEAKFAPNKNLVTRALGIEANVSAEIHDYPTQTGDVYCLCSDGLSDMVSDPEIAVVLDNLGEYPDAAAEQLIDMANERGGRDNISVIIIRIQSSYALQRSWWQKLLAR